MGKNKNMNEIKEKLKIANDRLLLYLKAEKAILAGQSYEMGDTKLTRANLKDVVSAINSLKKELRGRSRLKYIRPIW